MGLDTSGASEDAGFDGGFMGLDTSGASKDDGFDGGFISLSGTRGWDCSSVASVCGGFGPWLESC